MRRIPSSTYRLQLHQGFTFDDAAKVADYLRALGISHIYCSPYLQAAPGSIHGYDVVDHQRSELRNLSLVDSDNRRPVDYDLRREMLRELQSGMDIDEIMQRMDSGMPKLCVVYNALHLRREHPEWFCAEAAYMPLIAEGSKSDHVIAYLRGDSVAVVATRWSIKSGGNWSGTTVELPQGQWKNIFTRERVTGGALRVQSVVRRFPVALLTREAE